MTSMDEARGEQLGWGEPTPAKGKPIQESRSAKNSVASQVVPESAARPDAGGSAKRKAPARPVKTEEVADGHIDLAAMAAGFDPVFLDPTSRRHLAQLAAGSVPTAMALVSDNYDLALGVAAVLASRWGGGQQVPKEAVFAEVYLCEPSGERWAREDLDTLVLERVSKLPRNRHVLILTAADEMDLRASERLLKTLEEPPSPTTFILLVNDGDRLPNTIKGRLERNVELGQAAASERIDALVATGTDRASAEVAVSLAGRAVTLAPLLARDSDVAALAASVIGEQEWGSKPLPVSHASALSERCLQLAACWEKGRYVETPKTITPALRARSRMIVRLGLSRHREATRSILRRTAVAAGGFLEHASQQPLDTSQTARTPASFEIVHARLHAADRCEMQLRSYAPIQSVLAALFIAG